MDDRKHSEQEKKIEKFSDCIKDSHIHWRGLERLTNIFITEKLAGG